MSAAERPLGNDDSASGETSITRALRLLVLFRDVSQPTAAEMASTLDMPISTVYRFLREFRRFGLVSSIAEGQYGVGPTLVQMTSGSSLHSFIAHWLEPTLHRLMQLSGETASAAVRDGLYARTVAQIESPMPVRLVFRIGELHPLYAGAAATVLLAFQPPNVVDAVVGLGRETMSLDAREEKRLRRKLVDTRQRGFVLSRGEVDPGIRAVAAPVLVGDEVLCAIGLVGSASRWKGRGDELRALVTESAGELSEAMSRTRAASTGGGGDATEGPKPRARATAAVTRERRTSATIPRLSGR